MKQFLSTICIAAACCASASAAIPTIDQITGTYIESDSTVYQDETTGVEQVMWSTCNDFTISRVEGSDDRIAISGFWRSLNGERHTIEATYSPTTGRITMPAGTVVWVDNQYGFDDNGDIVVTGQEEINIYNYTYNTSSGAWELSERDIVFSYDEETGRWCHNGYIAVTEEGSVYEAPYNTTFIRANGTVTNESYSFNSTGDRNDYGEESRPCYVDFSTGTILNLLYTDKYGHGTQVNFEAHARCNFFGRRSNGRRENTLRGRRRILRLAGSPPHRQARHRHSDKENHLHRRHHRECERNSPELKISI